MSKARHRGSQELLDPPDGLSSVTICKLGRHGREIGDSIEFKQELQVRPENV
jgi:hypothetical protein